MVFNPFPDPGNRPYGRKWKMAPVCPGSLPLTIPVFLPVEGGSVHGQGVGRDRRILQSGKNESLRWRPEVSPAGGCSEVLARRLRAPNG